MSELTNEKFALGLGWTRTQGLTEVGPGRYTTWRSPHGEPDYPPDFLHDLAAAVWEVFPRLGWHWSIEPGVHLEHGVSLCHDIETDILCEWFKTPGELATGICQAWAAGHPELFGEEGIDE